MASSTPTAAKTITTPNGTVIAFESKPKRRYLVNGEEGYVSVTEALDVLGKDALPWWGMTIGVGGVHALVGMGIARLGQDEQGRFVMAVADEGVWKAATPELLVSKLTEIKHTVNHVKESGGKRGQSAHDALEVWGVTGELPDPSTVTFEEQPYVQALRDFLELITPRFEVLGNERMVASIKHKYAGRYDISGVLREEVKVVTKVFPKAQPKHALLPVGSYLLDLKTSKDIYTNHPLQLKAYDDAGVENGYDKHDHHLVLQVGADGRYQARLIKQVFEESDYATIVEAFHVVARAKEAIKV